MARIRTIKPDYWTDGKVVSWSPFARLLFIGMWNFTMCDHGHVADDPMKLKLQILPMDDVDIDALLAEIMDSGRVKRVTDPEGRTYLHITRFGDHQKIDPRWKTRCPACATPELAETHPSLGEPRRDSPELPETPPRKGREGKKTTSTASQVDGFDDFWAAYPRKDGKGKALPAYERALKRAEPATILAGALKYAATVKSTERQYIKLPEGWLNADRWADESLAEANKAETSFWTRGPV
ncbi:MAG: hypothetical protein K0S70_181 [Microbacterium sp.]|jgi:hypothetical protein|nr:hypothetical protein [Microbacterium sp.]